MRRVYGVLTQARTWISIGRSCVHKYFDYVNTLIYRAFQNECNVFLFALCSVSPVLGSWMSVCVHWDFQPYLQSTCMYNVHCTLIVADIKPNWVSLNAIELHTENMFFPVIRHFSLFLPFICSHYKFHDILFVLTLGDPDSEAYTLNAGRMPNTGFISFDFWLGPHVCPIPI